MALQTVHLFVFEGLADWEASYAIAGINNPATPTAAGRYRVQTVGITREPVTTMGGVRVLPDMSLGELDLADSALLILPGGERWDEEGLGEVMPCVARFLAAGVPVAAICGATAGLARAGFLDAVRHTSNAAEYLQATGYRGAGRYVSEGAVEDGGIITAGASGALEFAAQIFRRLKLYSEEETDAWYRLFKTGDASGYARLAAQAGA
jgi:putative intracellular protease/amidase